MRDKTLDNSAVIDQAGLREVNKYLDPAFPVGMYTVTIDGIVPEGRGHLDLHWHEDLQYTMVLSGNVTMQVNGEDYHLSEGQAIFINKNLLHETMGLSDDGKYFSINFPDKLLGYFTGSRMELDLVGPYTDNLLFPVLVLDGSEEWHGKVLDSLSEIRRQMSGLTNAYQYKVSILLVEMWYEIITNIGRLDKPSAAYIRKQERMQTMLSFIHENYSDDIFLKDIAASAGVSETECCRCFRDTIHESPNKYLIRYRISKASELLTGSDLSVTEVALESGFNDTSHFIDYFRKRTGKTPYDYRHRN